MPREAMRAHPPVKPLFKGGLLYVEGAADFFNTTPKAIRAKVALHRLPFYKLDGRIVFFRDELEQVLRDLQPCVSLEEVKENLALRSGDMVRR